MMALPFGNTQQYGDFDAVKSSAAKQDRDKTPFVIATSKK